MVQSSEIEPIYVPQHPSRAFNNFFIAYARAFNKANHRTGALFETPFGRKPIDNPHYFTTLIRYIHRNPQKHGLIPDFRDWPWSSYKAILSTKPTNIAREEVLAWFGGQTPFADAHLTEEDKPIIGVNLLYNEPAEITAL